MPKAQELLSKFNLVSGEDTYASQTSQNPATSRRILSLIPSKSGLLTRELGEATYLPTNLGASVGALFQYDFNNTSGVGQSVRFAATSTSLYKEVAGAWVLQSLPTNAGTTSATALSDYPQFCVINNLLHFADGVTSWIYDGLNNAFVLDGFEIPATAPGFISVSVAGNITATIGRYYWYTYADETTGRGHESSSGLISASSGPLTSKQVTITPQAGTVATTSGSKSFTLTSSNSPTWVGMHLYVLGTDYGPIASITGAGPSTGTLVNNAPATNASATFLIAPVRATHVHIYCSETDGSKLGQFVGSMPVTTSPPNFTDNSPFINQANTLILDIDRPFRNDPPPNSKLLEIHKFRIFRRVESTPNEFAFTANEEVSSGNNGSPQESTPGADPNTLSDIVNVDPYPRPSNRIRALKSHADALYIGTDKDTTPLYGDSIDDFGLSQVTAISNGIISRWGMESTPHGLVLFTYDRKLLLYPPASPVFSITAKDINVTDSLQEIGLSMRNKFLAIKNSDQDNVRVKWYNYNSRDWLVVCFQDNTSTHHTYVYDFSTKGWFELQRGFVSVEVFEPTAGQKILVGGGTDGLVYVIDDLQGTFTNATLPAALFRTALIDFGHPDMLHVPDYFEYEVSNAAMADSATVNFYLDPADADNPGTALPLEMSPVVNRPNLFRGFFAPSAADAGADGVLCKRLMIELNVASDTNAGSFRGVMLKADPAENLFQ